MTVTEKQARAAMPALRASLKTQPGYISVGLTKVGENFAISVL